MSKYKTPSYKFNEYPHKKVKGKEFNYLKYEGIKFRKVVFRDCTFNYCDYRGSGLGINGSKYIGCKWINSKFWGKYSSFGSISEFGRNAIFKNCEFSNVLIKTASMNGVRFVNCSFSGTFQSLIFYGPTNKVLDPVVFKNVDLSKVKLKGVSFRCGVDLSSVRLPEEGIRVFNNPNGKFSSRLREKSKELREEAAIPLRILGHEFNDPQDPMIFEENLLVDFLDTEESLRIFEDISKDYIIA